MSLTSRRTAMARKRYKPEEIIAKLKDRCSGLAGDVARRHDRAGPCQAGQALEAPCAPENACCEGLAWAACKTALHAPLQHQYEQRRGEQPTLWGLLGDSAHCRNQCVSH